METPVVTSFNEFKEKFRGYLAKLIALRRRQGKETKQLKEKVQAAFEKYIAPNKDSLMYYASKSYLDFSKKMTWASEFVLSGIHF